ncbi:MAG TPA: SPOR domain-containing protein [Candidatus Marinimicrobia bacterium]|nr:SPOR domain-containing protein [Candidatus Neomarinimicrobiota bacterium]HIB52549.1 SPOR domain-containing protein [Candidatus Neomarinimicrobiota bacterium]
MKIITVLLYISLLSCIAFSQEQDESIDPNTLIDYKPNWPIVVNPLLDMENLKNNEDVRDTSEIIIEGYRVQALVTRNTHSADSIRAVLSDKIDEDVYITYEVPYYKIRVGNCVDRKQAEELKLKLVELGYASAWIIRTRVKAPEFIREY